MCIAFVQRRPNVHWVSALHDSVGLSHSICKFVLLVIIYICLFGMSLYMYVCLACQRVYSVPNHITHVLTYLPTQLTSNWNRYILQRKLLSCSRSLISDNIRKIGSNPIWQFTKFTYIYNGLLQAHYLQTTHSQVNEFLSSSFCGARVLTIFLAKHLTTISAWENVSCQDFDFRRCILRHCTEWLPGWLVTTLFYVSQKPVLQPCRQLGYLLFRRNLSCL